MTDRRPLGADPWLGHSGPHAPRPFVRLADGGRTDGEADVAEEVPVALVYGTQPYAVMMCTPLDLEDLAVGFSVTEGIVSTAADVREVWVTPHSRGIEVRMAVPDASRERLRARARSLPARAGCGLCGIEAIDEVVRTIPPVTANWQVDAVTLAQASEAILAHQAVHAATRATHAAAWIPRGGGAATVREDVGRHNALDKLLGALWRANIDPADGYVVLTSRLSYELVQKVAVAGVPVVAAASRPTGLALRLAEGAGIAVAHVRDGTVDVYTHAGRVG